MIRKTREEKRLVIVSDLIREYGYVHRIPKGDEETVFIQRHSHYLCNVEPVRVTAAPGWFAVEEGFLKTT